MTGTKIRPARFEDIEDMTTLLALLFSIEEDFDFDAQRQQRGLNLMLQNNNGIILVAESDSRVVGMCMGQLMVSTAEGGWSMLVEDVVILPDFRKRGLARLLLDSLAVWGTARGVCRLQLLADINNSSAHRFYEHLGWQRTALGCFKKY